MSFFKPRISLSLNFASPFSLMTHNYSEIPQFKNYMLWTKRSQQCTAFQKFIFHTTSSESIYILHHCPVSWKFTPVYFFSPNFICFLQKQPIKVPVFKLSTTHIKILMSLKKSLMSFFKQKVSFSSKFESFFNVMRDHSFVLFQLKLYMVLTKLTHQSANSYIHVCLH